MNTYPIVNGPNKWDLMQALFAPCGEVTFTVHDSFNCENLTHKVKVLEVGAEDGSGESWCLRVLDDNNKVLKVYYRTDRRCGTWDI